MLMKSEHDTCFLQYASSVLLTNSNFDFTSRLDFLYNLRSLVI